MHTKSGRSTACGRRAIATALFAVSVASIALSSLEVFAQGPMSPGGGAMAPQPRVAPPPPPPPPPPVMAPVSPGTQPGSPASVAPRSTTKNSDNDSPTPRDRSTTTGGGTIKSPDNNSPLPQNRAPATTGGTAGRAAPVPSAPTERSQREPSGWVGFRYWACSSAPGGQSRAVVPKESWGQRREPTARRGRRRPAPSPIPEPEGRSRP